MKLSTKGKYGVKAMVELAVNYGENPISIKTISKKQGISEYYLEQLFSSLRKAKLIKSIRGAQGGYILTRPPKEITIAEVMDVLEGPIEIADCIDGAVCNNIDCCATQYLWRKIKDSIDNVLLSTTLEDIVEDYKEIVKKKQITKVNQESEKHE